MVGKQSVSTTSIPNPEEYKIADEELTENLILRSWKGVLSQVQRVREFNASQNVPNVDNYIGYYYDGLAEPMGVKQKRRWLEKTRHKKSGKYITVSSLIESGRISDVEKEVFGTKDYPYIECHTMTRVLTRDNKQYLARGMRVYGVTEIGAVLTLPFYDADFTRKIPISPSTAKDKDGNDIKILTVGTGEFTYESSPKIYLTPWSNGENARATLEKYPLSEDSGTYGKITYMFKREDTANEIAVSEEEFFSDFDSVWNAKTAPKPTISIDSKTLLNFSKLESEARTQHQQYK